MPSSVEIIASEIEKFEGEPPPVSTYRSTGHPSELYRRRDEIASDDGDLALLCGVGGAELACAVTFDDGQEDGWHFVRAP